MGERHLTRLQVNEGVMLASYRPVCSCGWSGAEFWSRSLAERAGLTHQLGRSDLRVAAPDQNSTASRATGQLMQ